MAERLPRISGTIHTADGPDVPFHITAEGWAQWGGHGREVHGANVDLLDALEAAAKDAGFFEKPEPEPEPAPDLSTSAEALATAARECVQHHHGFGIPDGCPVAALIPQEVMPTPETLAAVYELTGTTEAQRLDRAVGKFRTNGTTESGWARMMLRRWAIKNAPAIPFYA